MQKMVVTFCLSSFLKHFTVFVGGAAADKNYAKMVAITVLLLSFASPTIWFLDRFLDCIDGAVMKCEPIREGYRGKVARRTDENLKVTLYSKKPHTERYPCPDSTAYTTRKREQLATVTVYEANIPKVTIQASHCPPFTKRLSQPQYKRKIER